MLSYEAINYFFYSTEWMNTMLMSNSADLFNFLLTTLFNLAKQILAEKDVELCVKGDVERHCRIFLYNGLDFHSYELPLGV